MVLGNFPFNRTRSLCVVLSLGVLFIFNGVVADVDSTLLAPVAFVMVGVAGVVVVCEMEEGGGGRGGVDDPVVGITVYEGGEEKVDELPCTDPHA